jgi:type II secretory pathway pseudopilin PulG
MMTRRKSMTGLSLIELLVAMTIALVAVLAATELYSSTRQTYRVQTMQNRLSEDGRFAISMLQRVITQAGFRPTPVAWSGVNPPLTATSDTSMTVRFIADGANQIGCNGGVVAANGNAVTDLVIASGAGTLDCSDKPGVTPDHWIAPAGAGTELVDFRLEYGNDTGPDTAPEFGCGPPGTIAGTSAGDCVADNYLLATAQAAPTRIVAVRACLVLRSDTTDGSIVKSQAPSNCSGVPIDAWQNDHRLYRTFRTTVLLRNR